ncbi:hypothetical protein PSTT_13235 [Puccinia striiformis]|uniref:Uncharacterized protein n=1 Tax=Puccinia striiformis TaxID=27350 RepID=A0A2S4USP2_9BASI|nr:hypothetical protein PSTT_13235 [Puccinia striiformis]
MGARRTQASAERGQSPVHVQFPSKPPGLGKPSSGMPGAPDLVTKLARACNVEMENRCHSEYYRACYGLVPRYEVFRYAPLLATVRLL